MTEQEQIEEIKAVLVRTCKRTRTMQEDYMQDRYAEALYNAGYRKQVEGEWLTDKYGMDRSVCSLCNACYEGDVGRYCPNCGAKMRGPKP